MVRLRMERLRGTLLNSLAMLAASHPRHMLSMAKQEIIALNAQMESIISRRLESDKGRMGRVAAALSALNPEATLARGYSITRTLDGKVITSPSQVAPGTVIRIQLAAGEIESVRKS